MTQGLKDIKTVLMLKYQLEVDVGEERLQMAAFLQIVVVLVASR